MTAPDDRLTAAIDAWHGEIGPTRVDASAVSSWDGSALGSGSVVLHVDTDVDLGLATRLDVTLRAGPWTLVTTAEVTASRDEQTASWRVVVRW